MIFDQVFCFCFCWLLVLVMFCSSFEIPSLIRVASTVGPWAPFSVIGMGSLTIPTAPQVLNLADKDPYQKLVQSVLEAVDTIVLGINKDGTT